MAINRDNIPVTTLDGGLVTSVSAAALDPRFSPSMSNIAFRKGIVEKRGGFVWVTNGHSTDSGTLDSGDPEYNLDRTPDVYELGAYHYQNSSALGFKLFWKVGLHLISGSPDTYMVVLAASSDLDPSGNSWTIETIRSAAGADTSDPQTVAINKDYWVNFCQVSKDAAGDGTAENEWLIVNVTPTCPQDVSSGAPLIQIDNGSGSGAEALVFGGGTDIQCKRVLTYKEKLVRLGDTTGTRVAWSKPNDPEVYLYDGLDGSGFAFLDDDGGNISNGVVLRDSIICFKENSTWVGTDIDINPFIRWTQLFSDVGLLAPRLLAKFHNDLYFVGQDNIYRYSGGAELEPIGEAVWDDFYNDIRADSVSSTGEQYYQWRAFTTVHRVDGDICFWIPTGSDFTWCTKAYVYNVFSKAWSIWTVPTTSTGNGFAVAMTGWGEFEGGSFWATNKMQPAYFGLEEEGDGTITDMLYSRYDPTVFTDLAPSASSAATTQAITASWETADFIQTLAEKSQWDRIYLDGQATGSACTLTVEASMDSGETWPESSTMSLVTANYATNVVAFNRANYSARFKFSNAESAVNFRLRSIEIQHGVDEAQEA